MSKRDCTEVLPVEVRRKKSKVWLLESRKLCAEFGWCDQFVDGDLLLRVGGSLLALRMLLRELRDCHVKWRG